MKGSFDDPFKFSREMIDLRDVEHVQVERMLDRLYVHVNGVTVLRIYGVKNFTYTHERTDESEDRDIRED